MERKWTKPPSIPENFVTIHHLQERWIKQQMQKQEEEPQSEPECKVVEIGEVLEEQKSTDGKMEPEKFKKRHGSNRWKEKKKQARARAAKGAKEDENIVSGETNAPEKKEASVVSMDGGRLTKMSTGGGSCREREKKAPEGTGSLSFSGRIQRKGEWKKVNKEEVTGVEAHAREKTASGNANVAYQTFNELEELSITGGKERGNDVRNQRSGKKEVIPKSKNDDQMLQIESHLINGGYPKGSYRSVERQKQRNMVWVKRGDASGGNAFELTSSGSSSINAPT